MSALWQQIRRNRSLVVAWSRVFLVGSWALSAVTGYYVVHSQIPPFPFVLPTILFSASFALGSAYSLYQQRQLLLVKETLIASSLGTALSSSCLLFELYTFPALLVGWVLAVCLLVSSQLIRSYVDKHDLLRRNVVILGAGARAMLVATRLRRRSDRHGFRLLGFIPTHGESPLVGNYGGEIVRNASNLCEYCSTFEVDTIVLAIDERRVAQGGGLPVSDLFRCRMKGVDIVELHEFFASNGRYLPVDQTPSSALYLSGGLHLGLFGRIAKRTIDILGSAIGLVFSFPLLLASAIAIKLEEGLHAPILYRQARVGQFERPFDVLKLRSMRVDAEADGRAVWASKSDHRVTRVGWFLRRTRVDELPQLLNVLIGQMSLVGPRPERLAFVQDLRVSLPYYDLRHSAKPGITGLAQVSYPYGASLDDAMQKLYYDLYYVRNTGIVLDLKILAETLVVVLWGRGAR